MDAMRHAPPRLQMTVPVPMKTGKVAMSPGEDGLIGIPFPEHSNELLSQLNDQRRSGHLCDLTLTSRGARYHTHRSVMAAVSLYFRRLFGTEEAGGEGGGGFSVCQLDCVAPDALDALLEFAYTATLTVPSSGMRDVLQGAQLLGIQCVADACREILGEEAGDVAEETRVQYTPPKKVTGEEVDVERVSRRKNDRKKVRRIGLNWINHSLVNPSPASPVSQPSIASDSLCSPPSTQSLSPDQELRLKSEWQNGDPESVKEPGRGAAPNGGHVHWIHDRPRIAHPPPVAAANHKPSQNDDTERFGEDGTFMGSTSVPTSASERVAVTATVGEGRKRKSQTPQQCPVCQKIIHGAGKLPRHMRTHTGEKPFQCSACGVRFTRNDKLKIHMRKHTGERPYPCPHCPARFLHSYDLKNHLSLHSGARPFECPLCHKAFAREDHLQRHRKGHSCLELRTRRSRRGPELMDNGREDGGRREPSDPLEVVTSQAHTSAFHPHMILDAASGHGVGPPLMFPGDMDRGRSLALQALSSQLGPHRLAGYSELFLRGLGLRGSREVQVEDPGGTHSPGRLREHWADEVEEKVGDEDVEEEE